MPPRRPPTDTTDPTDSTDSTDSTDTASTTEAASPLTGLTRADWERTAARMLTAVQRHALPGRALIQLPGPASGSGHLSDGLEGYARTFLLAAYAAAHATPARADRLLAPYAEGLATGTAGQWPSPATLKQARVEAAAVAIALHETRERLWDRLPDAVRQRTVNWLSGTADTQVSANNWVWFKAVVAAFLRSVGAPHSQDDIDQAIETTETLYAGGGWYSDGARVTGQGPRELRDFDHYNGWAMHLFPLWYCRMSGDRAEPELLPRYRDRLRAFLHDAQHLVAADGAPLHHGRSLTYRFATAAPFLTGALFDATPLAPGLTRRAASGMLRHFLDRGALTPDDLLSLGWHGRFELIRQDYSGPASPYWASQAFAGLLLPPGHPVWTEPEERLPVERGDFTRLIAAPGWVVSGTAADGIVRFANHGTDHTAPDRPARDNPYYARLAYATHTGPDLGPPLDLSYDPEARSRDGDARAGQGPDNRVALVRREDGALSHRSPLRRLRLTGRTAVSAHVPHWPLAGEAARERWPAGPAVVTAAVLNGPWEVRLVRVAADGHTVSIGGHALAADAPPTCRAGARHLLVTRPDGLTSGLFHLTPADPAETADPAQPAATLREHRATAVNAFGPHSCTPVYEAPGSAHAVAVFLGRTTPTAPPQARLTPTAATVLWPDGTTDTVTWPTPPPPA